MRPGSLTELMLHYIRYKAFLMRGVLYKHSNVAHVAEPCADGLKGGASHGRKQSASSILERECRTVHVSRPLEASLRLSAVGRMSFAWHDSM